MAKTRTPIVESVASSDTCMRRYAERLTVANRFPPQKNWTIEPVNKLTNNKINQCLMNKETDTRVVTSCCIDKVLDDFRSFSSGSKVCLLNYSTDKRGGPDFKALALWLILAGMWTNYQHTGRINVATMLIFYQHTGVTDAR